MRSIAVLAMVLAGVSNALADDYTEVRELTVSAEDLENLIINSGAGTLDVTGVSGMDGVTVKATIVIPGVDADDGRKMVAEDLDLSLKREGNGAVLISEFDDGFWGFNKNGRVNLEVHAPASVSVQVDDSSGSLDLRNFVADVRIDDGSGSIDVHQVGSLYIDDGSGSVDVGNVKGDVHVNDGSGSITIDAVGGSVTIDDGSGGIRVSDVAKDLIILGDGSGGVSFSDIRGAVEEDG